MKKLTLFLALLGLCPQDGDCAKFSGSNEPVRIAVIADVHVQDTSVLRTMDDQLHSTRLFNENYFAFLATLDDIARRDIRHVVLPGDLTDDGQPVNVRLVKDILRRYAEKHRMRFLVMTGNHDPSRPFTTNRDRGDMACWGFREIHEEWKEFGFFPQKDYLYWSTPFSSYSYEDYTFSRAVEEAARDKRVYRYAPDSVTVLSPDIPDGSYLVEQAGGIWTLMIDASVYHPETIEGDSIVAFKSAGTGYKDVLKIKKHLLPWIRQVAAEAKEHNKTLIAFSHYPMSDYNSGAASFIPGIARPGRFDVQRFPTSEMTELLADAGIAIHFGGHIHMNDDAIHTSAKGNKLRNIQVPSTGGYAPGYKILTIGSNGRCSVETVALNHVPGFDSFFPLYRQEHKALREAGKEPLWDESVLESRDYREFCEAHLRELVRLRFLPGDLLPVAEQQLVPMRAEELFKLTGLPCPTPMDWTGFDLIVDFYKLRMGGESALEDISPERVRQYTLLMEKLIRIEPKSDLEQFLTGFSGLFQARLKAVTRTEGNTEQ